MRGRRPGCRRRCWRPSAGVGGAELRLLPGPVGDLARGRGAGSSRRTALSVSRGVRAGPSGPRADRRPRAGGPGGAGPRFRHLGCGGVVGVCPASKPRRLSRRSDHPVFVRVHAPAYGHPAQPRCGHGQRTAGRGPNASRSRGSTGQLDAPSSRLWAVWLPHLPDDGRLAAGGDPRQHGGGGPGGAPSVGV